MRIGTSLTGMFILLFCISGCYPNLVVRNLDVTWDQTNKTARAEIANIGYRDSGKFLVDFNADENPVLPNSIPQVSHIVPGLARGDSVVLESDFAPLAHPDNNLGNVYKITVIADPNNMVLESNDNDNSKYAPVGSATTVVSADGRVWMDRNLGAARVATSKDAPVGIMTTVVSADGRVWMDRNLGAARVATSMTDTEAYGDLYQWGRNTDGHQLRTSATTHVTSSNDYPGHGFFILQQMESPWDWRVPQNDNLWQGVNGTNNPCPKGFRLPTEDEWRTEYRSWPDSDYYSKAELAFNSPLKLVTAGYRAGTLERVDEYSCYWTSTTFGNTAIMFCFSIYDIFINGGPSTRAQGFSVRCIKE